MRMIYKNRGFKKLDELLMIEQKFLVFLLEKECGEVEKK
jgi:hypothetical protein